MQAAGAGLKAERRRAARGLRVLPRSLALLGALVALQAFAAASAGAASTVYGQIGSFGGKQVNAADPGLFSASPMPQRLAVDPTTGDVFVADTGNNRIEVFQPTATSASFLLQFGSSTTTNHPVGVTVDPATGDVYVSCAGTTNAIVKFDPDSHANPTAYTQDLSFTSPAHGTGTGQIGSFASGSATSPNAGGIAVDPATGDILVADPGNKLIQRFTSAGAFVGAFDGSSSGSAFTKPFDLAVNGAGNVIVADVVSSSSARVLRFNADGSSVLGTLTVPNTSLGTSGVVLGADRLAGETFVSSKSPTLVSPGLIFRFDAGDRQIQQFGASDGSLNGLLFGVAASSTDPGRVYVLATNSFLGGTPKVQVFQALTPPTVAIEPPTDVTATAATLHGTVNPQGSQVTDCHFEYVPQSDPNGLTDAQSAACAPGPAGIGAGNSDVTVQASVAGLQPNTPYRVRLVAANNGGTVSATSAEEPFGTLTAPPTVVTSKVYSLSDSSATLSATVNPENSQVADCHFDWGATAAYGNTVPCSPAPGAGGVPVQVSADLHGLAPSTTYHFRIVADNGTSGPQMGNDQTFTTYSAQAAGIPNRGYELVSPANTNGIDPRPNVASADGDYYVYNTYIPSPGSTGGGLSGNFRAARNPNGTWTQQPIAQPAPPAGQHVTAAIGPMFSGDDLSRAVFSTQLNLDPDDQNSGSTAADTYLDDVTSGFTWISRNPSIPSGTAQTDPANAGAQEYISPDGKVVLFNSNRHLLAADTSCSNCTSLYEWDNGQLSLVGIPPGQTTGFTTGSRLGSAGVSRANEVVRNAVSQDGSRVVFEATDTSGDSQLYVRIGGQSTVEASASAPDVSPAVASPQRVNFWGADADDDTVFFTSSSALTADSTATGANSDLYAYQVPADGNPADGQLTDLTPYASGAGVSYVLDVSDDGQRVYFTSSQQLTAGQGVAGGPNLYLAQLSRGQVTLTFIATVNLDLSGSGGGGLLPSPAWREISANADGSVIAFRSADALVPNRLTGGLPQIYVYDAAHDVLNCASCPGDGSAASAGADLTPSQTPTQGPLGNGNQNELAPHVRNVSSDGTVFFQTATSLLPAATNAGAIDVYEWHGGNLGLISGGTSTRDSIFAGASADGSTVFFRSSQSLVSGAQDGIDHIYAARVGGGYNPPTPAPDCSGDDCRGPLSGPPVPPSIGSVTFSGPGSPSAKTKPTVARVKVTHKTVKRAAFVLSVRVPAKGKVTVSGRYVKKVSKSVSRAGTYKLTLKLTSKAKKQLKKRRKLKVPVKVAYRPVGGKASTAAVSVELKA